MQTAFPVSAGQPLPAQMQPQMQQPQAAYDANQVVQQLQMLYAAQTDDQRKAPDGWLQAFSKTTDAWSIAEQLVRSGQHEDVQFFGARTLSIKMRYDFSQLSRESYEPMRSALVEHVRRFQTGPKKVLVHLCVAFSALSVHLRDGRKVVSHLLSAFGAQDAFALLSLLQALPTECSVNRTRISVDERNAFLKELKGSAGLVLDFLMKCAELAAGSVEANLKIFECFAAWLRVLSFNEEHLSRGQALLQRLFDALESADLFDTAVDTIEVLVQSTSGDVQKFSDVQDFVLRRVLALQPRLLASIQKDEQDTVQAFSRLVCEVLEGYLNYLLSLPMNVPHYGLLSMLLELTGYSDMDTSEMTLNTWFAIAQAITDGNHTTNPDAFAPVFQSLVGKLLGVCEYPDDYETLNPNDQSEVDKFRKTCGDTFCDCFEVLKSDSLLQLLNQAFITAAPRCSENWRPVESVLFALKSISTRVLPTEATVLPGVLGSMQHLPNIPLLVRHGVELIGRYAHWIKLHPEQLANLFPFVTTGLSTAEVAPFAAQAFHQLASECTDQFVERLDAVLGVYESAVSRSLETQDLSELIVGLTKVLQRVPFEHVLGALQRICLPMVTTMQRGVEHVTSGHAIDKTTSTVMCSQLNLIGAAVKNLQIPIPNGMQHPVVDLLGQSWAVLTAVFNVFGSDENTMESACRALKYAIRTVQTHFAPLLAQFIDILRAHYTAHKHAAFLYVGAQCVSSFGREGMYQEALFNMLLSFSDTTFTILRDNDFKNFTDHPDIVEDFFELCASFIRTMPNVLMPHPLLPSLFQCALVGVTIAHKEASNSVFYFFEKIFRAARPDVEQGPSDTPYLPIVQQLLGTLGLQLMTQLVTALVNRLQHAKLTQIAKTLRALIDCAGQAAYQWLCQVLIMDNKFKDVSDDRRKTEFMHNLLGARTDERALSVLKSFSKSLQQHVH